MTLRQAQEPGASGERQQHPAHRHQGRRRRPPGRRGHRLRRRPHEGETVCLARPETNRHFFARAEAFLATHLGGRCEPADDGAGHSGTDH